MGIYSETTSNTPSEIVDLTPCNNCNFDCDVHGYCRIAAISDNDLQEKYLYDTLKDKGYGGCNLKVQNIRGKNWLILYPFRSGYLLAEKMNVECGVPVVPLKTRYTSGLPGLNVSNCYTRFLDMIDQVSPRDEPVHFENVVSVDDMYQYCLENFSDTIEHCREINIVEPCEVINLVAAFHHIDLAMITDESGVMGYIPPKELVL